MFALKKRKLKKHRMKNYLILLFLGLSMSLYSQNRSVAGETFPAQLDIKGSKLTFNGAGLREKYTIDLYVAALYLPKQSMDGAKIINADEMQAINIKIVSNKVTREKFNETVKEGFAKVSEGKASASEISKFQGFFSAPIKKGDDIQIIYKPGKGTAVMINGSYKGKVEGVEFKKALFSIWLGKTPADSGLKKEMLGKA
jgi:hypothetical protein